MEKAIPSKESNRKVLRKSLERLNDTYIPSTLMVVIPIISLNKSINVLLNPEYIVIEMATRIS